MRDLKIKLSNPLCIFDLETTGTNISQDRIVEIAVVKLMPSGERITKSNLVNPGFPIPAASSAIHGIYDEDVKDKPLFKELAKEYARFMEGCDISGFNVQKFDIPILAEEFLRAEVDFDFSKRRVIDAQKIFHMMEKRTLSAAYKFYCDKELEDAHSAEADALATLEVLIAQLERYDGKAVTDMQGKKIGIINTDMAHLHQMLSADVVDLAGRFSKNEKGEVVFNFGKHKNKTVKSVLKSEPSYYDWMMQGDFPLDTKRKLTEIKLEDFGK
ncbi:MAG TPA: 3'-5' exonuclease [Cyclobacteriaceae bacterium]|nr:3'-5' exonuclease [Cyclobacteriaceae bacterium]